MQNSAHPLETMSALPTTEQNYKDSLLKSLVKYLSGDSRAGPFPSVCAGELQDDGVNDGEVKFFLLGIETNTSAI